MAATPPVCEFGWQAPAFTLPGTDDALWSLDRIRGPKGTLVAFICNHCPYVTGAIGRFIVDARDLQAAGIGVAAICSNDAKAYPADSFPRMKVFAEMHAFPFPYLHDETQSVARAWGAACTPDFFGFDADLGLQYRGRLDSAGIRPSPDASRDLRDAMLQVAATGAGPKQQIASMGCSIKWKVS